ncbi:uncharacterized protein LOC142574593 [Dermacentor variabilis]|uniref:uncharacterized protein LOC142574593 n=1 Tax=Dermacentor variabilis TaxID=34621 RepID=UPI003F5B1392
MDRPRLGQLPDVGTCRSLKIIIIFIIIHNSGYVRLHEIIIIIISPNAGDLAPITSASDEKQELIRSSKMVATAVGLLLLLTTAAIQSPASAQFCPPSYREKNPEHTACKRRNMWCRIKVAGVNSTERALILKLHNDFRGQTALGKLPGFSTAADMQELLWDDELEYVAQAHASLCTTPDGDLKHDDVKNRFTSRFEKTGQNLAWIGRSNYKEGANWTWAMDGWFTKEYPLYPPRGVIAFAPIKNVKIGHFTQVIWAKTRYVGCGYVYYNVDGARYPHMKHYTCNYGPAGNYKGQRIYQEGPTCSACPNSTRCLWTAGLCSGPPGGQSGGKPPYNRRPPVGRTSPRPTPTPPRRPPDCPPCPCLRSMLQRYPSPHATQRRDPPYAQDPAPRPYPLPYNSRLGGGLPGCKGVEGYKPGEPGQPACVENDFGGSGGIPRADYSDGAHDGRPGPGADFWLPFVAGFVTVLAVAALSAFIVFWRSNASADGAEAKLSTDATVTPAYYVASQEIIIIIIISPTTGDLAPITSASDEKQELIRSSKMVATAVGLLLLLTTAAIQSPASAQFCPLSYRKKNPEHTACKRRNMWCRIKSAGVHPKVRASILKMHNDFRSQTALGKLPGFQTAADMQELLWDDELADVAQAHANQCTTPDGDLKNDKVEDRFTSRFEQTGQNTAWIGRPDYVEGPNWTWTMDGWFTKEYKLYPPRDVPKFAPVKDAKIGHFTQIIWAKTLYVGCGYVYYRVDGALYPHMKQYTCNYGPSGNYMGQPIYQEGPTCSACPNSTRCNQATGLCITSRSPNWKTTAPTPSRRLPVTSRPQPPGKRCPPCPCLPPTPSPPAYPRQRRNPPYAHDPAPRPYPLPYDPRLGGGLPRCKYVEGYKPGKPGQPPCVQGDFGGVGSGTGSDDSDGAHSGRPGRDGDIWLPFALGVVTGLVVVALCVFLVLCLSSTSVDHTEAKLSTSATVTPAY